MYYAQNYFIRLLYFIFVSLNYSFLSVLLSLSIFIKDLIRVGLMGMLFFSFGVVAFLCGLWILWVSWTRGDFRLLLSICANLSHIINWLSSLWILFLNSGTYQSFRPFSTSTPLHFNSSIFIEISTMTNIWVVSSFLAHLFSPLGSFFLEFFSKNHKIYFLSYFRIYIHKQITS